MLNCLKCCSPKRKSGLRFYNRKKKKLENVTEDEYNALLELASFNDIIIQRLNTSGVKIQSIALPIAYGPKEKFLVRLKQDPNLDAKTAITLPRIGFEISSYQYAGNRKLSSTIKNINILNSDKARLKSQYVPVPYDITFALSIFVFERSRSDKFAWVISILDKFTPDKSASRRSCMTKEIVSL